jgi:hypothetical protein
MWRDAGNITHETIANHGSNRSFSPRAKPKLESNISDKLPCFCFLHENCGEFAFLNIIVYMPNYV